MSACYHKYRVRLFKEDRECTHGVSQSTLYEFRVNSITDIDGDPVTGKFDYASAVGMLMYLCSNTRPNIQFAAHQCARFTHFPKKSHEDAITPICRYLQGTKDKGLRFKPDGEMKMDCYFDADFAGLCNVENHKTRSV